MEGGLRSMICGEMPVFDFFLSIRYLLGYTESFPVQEPIVYRT